jgi:hypothetical protein
MNLSELGRPVSRTETAREKMVEGEERKRKKREGGREKRERRDRYQVWVCIWESVECLE